MELETGPVDWVRMAIAFAVFCCTVTLPVIAWCVVRGLMI